MLLKSGRAIKVLTFARARRSTDELYQFQIPRPSGHTTDPHTNTHTNPTWWGGTCEKWIGWAVVIWLICEADERFMRFRSGDGSDGGGAHWKRQRQRRRRQQHSTNELGCIIFPVVVSCMHARNVLRFFQFVFTLCACAMFGYIPLALNEWDACVALCERKYFVAHWVRKAWRCGRSISMGFTFSQPPSLTLTFCLSLSLSSKHFYVVDNIVVSSGPVVSLFAPQRVGIITGTCAPSMPPPSPPLRTIKHGSVYRLNGQALLYHCMCNITYTYQTLYSIHAVL